MAGYVFVIQSDVNGHYYMFYNGAAYTYGVDPTLATANIGMVKGSEMTGEIFTWYDAAGAPVVLNNGTTYDVRWGVDGRLWP